MSTRACCAAWSRSRSTAPTTTYRARCLLSPTVTQVGRGEEGKRRAAVVALIGLSLVACIVQVVGTAAGWDGAGRAQWFAMPLLALALVLAHGLRESRGRW